MEAHPGVIQGSSRGGIRGWTRLRVATGVPSFSKSQMLETMHVMSSTHAPTSTSFVSTCVRRALVAAPNLLAAEESLPSSIADGADGAEGADAPAPAPSAAVGAAGGLALAVVVDAAVDAAAAAAVAGRSEAGPMPVPSPPFSALVSSSCSLTKESARRFENMSA